MKKINSFCLKAFIGVNVICFMLFVVFMFSRSFMFGIDFAKISKFINGWTLLILFIYINSIFLPLYSLVLYVNINLARNYKRINNKDIVYQRELPDYNCALAGYIYEGVIDSEIDFKALLMELEVKKYLIKSGNTYVVDENFLTSNPFSNDNKSCSYVIDVVRGKENFNSKKFKKIIIKDALNLKLITGNGWILVLFLILFFTGSILHIFTYLYIATYTDYLEEIGYRFTKDGALERDKMIKLKAFLHDFSTIQEIKNSENNIWERYLPFAVALEENENFNK